MAKKKKLGILTGGGPAPSLNAVISAAARPAIKAGWEVIGFKDGWKGVLKGDIMPISEGILEGIPRKSGTILGTSRTNLKKVKISGQKEPVNKCSEGAKNLDDLGLNGLIAIGGEDTISVAEELVIKHNQPINCVAKTIDNDVCGTQRTLGWDTACNNVANRLRDIHEDFKATHYVAVVEVMGRDTGWLALYGGLAGDAHVILTPEFPMSIEDCVTKVVAIHKRLGYCIVVVAEDLKYEKLAGHIEGGETDAFRHDLIAKRTKGWAKVIAEEIEERSDLKARPIVLGHIQRGGPPSAADTVMGLWMGKKAFELVKKGTFGKLVAWENEAPKVVSISVAGGGKTKYVDQELYSELSSLEFSSLL